VADGIAHPPHPKEDAMRPHRRLLLRIIVILTVKVKISVVRR